MIVKVRVRVSRIVAIKSDKRFLSYCFVMGNGGFRRKALSFYTPPGFLFDLLIQN